MTNVLEDFPIKTEVVANGELNGIHWVSARAPIYGAVNGYVRLPDGHPWLEVENGYDIKNSVPWGEITYQYGNWIGFDTLHSGQYWPGEAEFMNRQWPEDTVMSADMVVGWTRQLALDAHEYVANGTYEI